MKKILNLALVLLSVSFLWNCSYSGSLSYYENLNKKNPQVGGETRAAAPKNSKTKKVANDNVKREGYAIQVGAFKNVNNAARLVDSLDSGGLDAFLFKENDVYKVRFGNFNSRDKARAQGKSLQDSGRIGEFFVVIPEDYSVSKAVLFKSGGEEYIRRELFNAAHRYIGVPYVWGGTSASGFDCSGLTRAVYRLNGISIPRVSRDQYGSGKSIAKINLKVGDLVFFATSGGRKVSHVGVYIGKNKFIHAPSKGKTVRIDNLDSSYWSKRYLGGRNYL